MFQFGRSKQAIAWKAGNGINDQSYRGSYRTREDAKLRDMHLWKKILLWVLGLVVLAMIGLAIVVAITFYNACSNAIWSEYISPDRTMKAVVFERNCGATSGFSTHLSLITNDAELPNSGGNVLSLKGRPESVAPDVSWDSDVEIHVHRRLNGEEFDPQTSWSTPSLFNSREIKIEYDP